jgi:hypothetical protein
MRQKEETMNNENNSNETEDIYLLGTQHGLDQARKVLYDLIEETQGNNSPEYVYAIEDSLQLVESLMEDNAGKLFFNTKQKMEPI